jgi:RNA polymerase sigma factor (TIGR02999 family)
MSKQTETHRITQLLAQVADGGEDARDELVTAVYQQLRKIAQRRMAGEGPNPSLQATELVHEAYLKLEPGMGQRGFQNRYDFYGVAAEAMRRILIDHARRRRAAKRGSGRVAVPIGDVAQLAETADPEAVLALNEAFEHLESENPDLAKVVRLRFFAGLSVQETAHTRGVSEPTVKRRWRFARTVLFEVLEEKN